MTLFLNNYQKNKVAIICQEEQVTYHQLTKQVNYFHETIEYYPEKIIFLPMKREVSTIYKLFACIEAGKIFIPVSYEITISQLRKLAKMVPNSIFWGDKLFFLNGNEKINNLPQKTLFIGFTSGTTGEKKGFVRNQESWLESFQTWNKVFGNIQKQVVTCLTPLHYSFGLYVLLQCFYNGQTFFLSPCKLFDRSLISKWENQLEVFTVPSILHEQLIKMENIQCSSGKLTIVIGGESTPISLVEKFYECFPQGRLISFYGSSETSFISYRHEHLQNRTLGDHLFPKVQLKIKEQNCEGIGTICVSSPLVFQGYIDEHNFFPTNGYFETKDIGRYKSFLEFIGRKDDCIIRKGEKIFPMIIENYLSELLEIKDVLIAGVSQDSVITEVVAFIVWNKKTISLTEINHYLKNRLIRRVKIDRIEEVSHIPCSSSGKKIRSF